MNFKRIIPLLIIAMMSITAMANYYVAKIGTTRYTSLKAAVDSASNGDTIKMISNDTTAKQINIEKDLTLDLNGKTIYYSGKNLLSRFIEIKSGKTLTITDYNTNEEGGIKCENAQPKSSTSGFTLITVSGTCVINKGLFSFAQTTTPQKACCIVSVTSSGTLIIYNGTFSTIYGRSGNNCGVIFNQGATTVNGGTIENKSDTSNMEAYEKQTRASAIYHKGISLTVNGGTIISKTYAIWTESGTAYLSSSAIYNGLINNGNDSTLILSDNVDFTDIDSTVLASAKTISYTRKTNNNRWGTVCLPFAPDKNDNVTYYSINSIDAANNYLDVVEVDNPEASTPYLFMLKSGNIFQATGSNTISKNETAKFVSKSGATLKGVFEKTAVFASQYDPGTSSITYNKVVDENSYYISNNTIFHINKYFNLKPYRAYFVLPTGTQSNSYQVAILDELTGVGSAENTKKSREIIGIYSLSGQKQSQLQKGINIVRYSDGTSQTINVSSR